MIQKNKLQEKPQKVWKSLAVEVPLNGTKATYENYTLKVSGEKGEVSKYLKFLNVIIEVEEDKIKISTNKFSKREKKIIHTYRAHIRNLIEGVKKGFTYKLKIVYSKFPITAEIKDGNFVVKNLLGEKVPRTFKIIDNVKIEIKSSEISVSGIDIEVCGQTAASIEQLTRITHLDRRAIQDGIYITEKPGRIM